MNIFVLDLVPQRAASYHCDKHVVKMTLETAQILSTVLGGPYRPTHINHPCVKWAMETEGNLSWLWNLGFWLGEEYRIRYGKDHKSAKVIRNMWSTLMKNPCKKVGYMTPFALAMPEQYKGDDPVKAYRAYYRGEKFHMATYTNVNTPSWMR